MRFRHFVVAIVTTLAMSLSPSAVCTPDSQESDGHPKYWAETNGNSVTPHGEHRETVTQPQPPAAEQPESPASSETEVQYSDSDTKLAAPHRNCRTYQDENKKMHAVCRPEPEPEPAVESEAPAEPRVITITTREAATLIAQGSGITRQPPGPKVVISKAFIVYTNPSVHYQTTTILGTTIDVEFTPTSYTWNWGDGTTTTTTDPGAPYPHQTVTHHYKHTATAVTTTLTTTWTTRYHPTGDTTWHTIEGTITTTETSTPYDLVRITSYLTDDAEEAQGH
ncbi:zinc transporter [Actinomyces naeslundii]|nr:zinc transporter [Actinomyces naeslundii]